LAESPREANASSIASSNTSENGDSDAMVNSTVNRSSVSFCSSLALRLPLFRRVYPPMQLLVAW
jgi:hypothetical protein